MGKLQVLYLLSGGRSILIAKSLAIVEKGKLQQIKGSKILGN